MKLLLRGIFGLLLIAVAMVLGFVGLQLPVHFEHVDERVLERAAEDGETLLSQAGIFLDFGKPGPARLLMECVDSADPKRAQLEQRAEELLKLYPQYEYSGGADPFFEQFIKFAQLPIREDKRSLLNTWLIAQENRAQLSGFLAESSNTSVRNLLSSGTLTGFTLFMPVSTAAGVPLETSILTSALLVQSGHFQPDVVIELNQLVKAAEMHSSQAMQQLEAFYISVLGLGQRMNWTQLAQWCQAFNTIDLFVEATTVLMQEEAHFYTFYASVLFAEDPQELLEYRALFESDASWSDIERALQMGQGALNYLIQGQQAIYEKPSYLKDRMQEVAWSPGVLSWITEHDTLAKLLLLGSVFGAGFFFLQGSRVCLSKREGTSAVRRLAHFFQNSAVGLIALVAVILLAEPSLLEQTVTEPGNLLLEFEISPQTNIIETDTMPEASIDQITVIVLLIFFMMQLVIYAICLIKLSQVKNTDGSAATKIKLLDNEESLFDTGLYVGLSGTVISLLMLAMGIVQASLVAAYASTLFGIIFVALLKILHVRPLKRRFIMEIEQLEHPAESGGLLNES